MFLTSSLQLFYLHEYRKYKIVWHTSNHVIYTDKRKIRRASSYAFFPYTTFDLKNGILSTGI